jgi:hypothetical protein
LLKNNKRKLKLKGGLKTIGLKTILIIKLILSAPKPTD